MQVIDLLVIGGGTSGYMVASGASQAGLKVILTEKSHSLGGLSVSSGCVPSKTMMAISEQINCANKLRQSGIIKSKLKTNLQKINSKIFKITDKIKNSTQIQTLTSKGVKVIFGKCSFIEPNIAVINNEKIKFKQAVIATGSRPIIPDYKNLDKINFITHEKIFDLDKMPETLLIVGATMSSLEFAQAFTNFGVKVTVIEHNNFILEKMDQELSWKIYVSLIKMGVTILTGYKIIDCYPIKENKMLECIDNQGAKHSLQAEEVLINLGQRPNIEALGLENAAVKFFERGIVVDKKLRTSNKNIFAIGDVNNLSENFTHIAEHHANVILRNLINKSSKCINNTMIPIVMYTTPEFAQIGLTEHQAIKKYGQAIKILKFNFSDTDSGIIFENTEGLIKVILHEAIIIGVSIFGYRASELISEWCVAMQNSMSIKSLANTIRAYPSISVINKRVASTGIYSGSFSLPNWKNRGFFAKILPKLLLRS